MGQQDPVKRNGELGARMQVTRAPFSPLHFSHLAAAQRCQLGSGSSREAEGGPHLNAHIHSGARKALTDFENLAHCGWRGLGRWREFQFPSPNGKLAKSPFSPTLSHTKNEKPAIWSSHEEENRWAA